MTKKKKNITVLGSGRWGSLIAWYLNKINHNVCLWGRKNTPEIKYLIKNRNNKTVFFDEKISITDDIECAINNSEYIIISINAQNLRSFLNDLVTDVFKPGGFYDVLKNKKIILCMKGIEIESFKRLSVIVNDIVFENDTIGIWVGPGHVKSILNGIPTCMVVDSSNIEFKEEMASIFNSRFIKCFIGNDIIGNEIGAAAKNILGIGAGILDGLGMQSLKGPLMVEGASEISKLIKINGGNEITAYKLCHLGDFEATLFSSESNNRKYGQMLIENSKKDINFVAEGVGTSKAIYNFCKKNNLHLPICTIIYEIINDKISAQDALDSIFSNENISYE